MIHKIERIVSTGKFRNYQATGDVALKKLTLIYADNGSGKTTLTSILRSLTLNSSDIISKRISTNSTNPQHVHIVQRDPTTSVDTNYRYNNTAWTSQFPDIEIFDIHFISENIYSGFEFTDEHRKQLHQFVIGAQGVAIQNQMEANKLAKSALKLTISGIENQLITSVGYGLTESLLPTFVNIPLSSNLNIDAQILTAEGVLASARANILLQTLPRLSNLSPINLPLPFEAIINDLSLTIQNIQNSTLEAIFTAHCLELTSNGMQGSEQWIQKGFNYFKHKTEEHNLPEVNCPFCKQPINANLEIISSYVSRFNEEFNSLILRLNGYSQQFSQINLANIQQRLGTLNSNNQHSIISWNPYIPANNNTPVFDIFHELDLQSIFDNAFQSINSKIQNPSSNIDPNNVIVFSEAIIEINRRIDIYNQNVTAYNSSINLFMSSIPSEQQALTELNRLNRIRNRFLPAIDSLCTQLNTENVNLRQLQTQYTNLVQQQETAATAFFSTYRDRINHYLTNVFRTPFRIEDVINLPPQGRATQSKIGYKLTIDGLDISFENNQINSVKECLSEGDKSTIALAFFLSKLDIDQRKDQKVLVFDDPLSSLDSNRRLYTVALIKSLMTEMKQVIVLSHNEFFLNDLSKGTARGNKKTLRITENFVTRSSVIEPLELEKLVANKYFLDVDELLDFIQHADITKKDHILGLMRNVLESHLRFKFYRQTLVIPENQRTFGNLITTLDTQGVQFRDNANRQQIIDKLKLINQISCKPHHGEPEPDYALIGVDPANIAIPELVNFVNDTLNLIDNQL